MVSADAVLQIWERMQRCSPADRALRLLEIASPYVATDCPADCDLGLRDWHLLQLYSTLFSAELAGAAECLFCAEPLEIELDTRALGGERPPAAPHYISRERRRFRLPNVMDLVAVAGERDRNV